MGHSVIYYGEHDGARTYRALELGPDDLEWGVVSPEAPEEEQAEALADAVAIITNGLSITTEMLSKMPNMKLLQVMSAGFDALDVPAIRELGIEVNLFARRWAAHWEALEQGDFQVGRGGWLGDYPDPSTFLDLFLSDNELNRSQWGSASYDELVREAGRTVDAASRLRLLSAAERQLVQQLPAIPVFHFSSVSLVSPKVGGYIDNPLDMHLLRYISLE